MHPPITSRTMRWLSQFFCPSSITFEQDVRYREGGTKRGCGCSLHKPFVLTVEFFCFCQRFFFFSLSVSRTHTRNQNLIKNREGRTPQGYVLSSSSSSSSVDSGQKGQNGANDSHRDEMRRVRQRQQEIANERAKEAAKERKKKEAIEKERKNQIAKSKKPESGGSRLGDGSSTNSSAERRNDRNPLQPLASHTSSYRYVSFVDVYNRNAM